MICFVIIVIILLENIENRNNYVGIKRQNNRLCGILSWVPQLVPIITIGVLVVRAMRCQYGQDSAKHNAFTMECSEKLLPTITVRQSKL